MIPALLFAAVIVPVPGVHAPGSPADGYEKVPAPNIQMRISQASATSVPWIDSNAWRYVRGLRKALYTSLPVGTAPLAAAEAYAWGAEALLEPDPKDVADLGQMVAFIKTIDAPRMPVRANIGIVDDGSAETGEVLNLLSRRNLLYKVVTKPDPALDLNIQIGSEQYPREAVKNPNDFAARVRERLSDDKRVLRLFGSYTVLANLTGEGGKARLHLVNYARRPVADLRVRVLGRYDRVKLSDSADPRQQARDIIVSEGGTEFTVPQLTTYAVVDLDADP